MATCTAVYNFLTEVNNRAVETDPATVNGAHLMELGVIELLTSDQFQQMTTEVQTLTAAQSALQAELAERTQLAGSLHGDFDRTHSILFHLHGKEAQAAETSQETKDRQSLQALEADLAAKQKAFDDLVAKRSLLDTLVPCGSQYVGLTGVGQAQMRDLGVRLYRVGDAEFDSYWSETQRVSQSMNSLADEGAGYYARLAALAGADRSYLWAISLGLSRTVPDPAQGATRFAQAYEGASSLSKNAENRLMASEIMFAIPRPLPDQLPALKELVRETRKLKVPEESALGVAAMLLFGQRGDGTFATQNLAWFLPQTRSYEAAALLAIMNVPAEDLQKKFEGMRAMFTGWGYSASDDVELSSAYLAVSELPVDSMSTKLSIIARGLLTYLQYPLVAASVLASVATLEANETLNLLEQAYTVVGRRATGMSQAELVCLAVRLIEGIRQELVGSLDSTAAATPSAPRVAPVFYGRPFFVPFVVMHNAYFSTYSGYSGAHPGHAHGFAGGGFSG